jgi:hypothetical protein
MTFGRAKLVISVPFTAKNWLGILLAWHREPEQAQRDHFLFPQEARPQVRGRTFQKAG